MLRLETNDGWWLVTHPDHAHLAGEFASKWGNELFAPLRPREHVQRGIFRHDDGWRERDAQPMITKRGTPAGFSTDLVGKYTAFEEIDLVSYLEVRRKAVQLIAMDDPYAAILISMHTHNLLSERADRSTMREDQLPWLDAFLVEQSSLQRALRERLLAEGKLSEADLSRDTLHKNFQVLQACDNLSLLSCVDFAGQATLLHPLPLCGGDASEVKVRRIGERTFHLTPYPLSEPRLTFKLNARFVPGKTFAGSDVFRTLLDNASMEELEVVITA
jgi:hypothetical protein